MTRDGARFRARPALTGRLREGSRRRAFEIVVQMIVAAPGDTFGWHSHVNVVAQGTLSFYHPRTARRRSTTPPGAASPTASNRPALARAGVPAVENVREQGAGGPLGPLLVHKSDLGRHHERGKSTAPVSASATVIAPVGQ
jgi:hypothetical protein